MPEIKIKDLIWLIPLLTVMALFVFLVNGYSYHDAIRISVIVGCVIGILMTIPSKPNKTSEKTEQSQNTPESEKQNPYKIESGFKHGVDGGYYYTEYKTKAEYDFWKVFPYIFWIGLLALGYLLSRR